MPHDTPDNRDTPGDGVGPDEQPTQPMPEQQAAAGADADATPEADAPTVPFEPVPAATEPIAPYVPIADYSASEPGQGGGTPPAPPLKPDRKSPVPWLIAAAVLIMGAAIAIGLWQPWAGDDQPPVTPAPSVTETPTIPPIEEPTEEPTTEPSPTEEPEPTQEPEPDPAPTEITPTPTVSVPPIPEEE